MSENIHEAKKAAFFKDWKDAPNEPQQALGFQNGWYKGWDAASAEVAALRSALERVIAILANRDPECDYGDSGDDDCYICAISLTARLALASTAQEAK
jgi:hypothetical protein